ncbi:MAG: TetR/AcrR family transcriptional regulator [Betaproteobacteria bacterium]|nr:TetR/AcrR family transcriptional regulator [Betaproteobacteria bacterium]
MRRTPRQQRSRHAVETIIEATARLLESGGIETLTTARIAEQAGYGIGTLYEYFPNKNAIIITTAQRELDKVIRAIQKSLAQANAEDTTTVIQKVIRALIRGFGGRQRLRGALLTTMIVQGRFSELTAPIEMIIEFLRQSDRGIDEDNLSRLNPEQLYVLTRAVTGAIRAWSMEGGSGISPEALEVELVRLAQSYINSAISGEDKAPALDSFEALPTRKSE